MHIHPEVDLRPRMEIRPIINDAVIPMPCIAYIMNQIAMARKLIDNGFHARPLGHPLMVQSMAQASIYP